MRLAPLIFLLVSCASSLPETECASNPALTSRAAVDACRARVRSDASPHDAAHSTDAILHEMHASAARSVALCGDACAPMRDGGAHGDR